jgi:ribosomal protein S18 acetylase RimI-like enzyme
MAELAFRRAEVADVPAIVGLLNAAYRGESSRAGWTTEADFLDGQRTDRQEIEAVLSDAKAALILLVERAALLGTVQVQSKNERAYLGMLAVAPPLQGRGFGDQLLREGERVAAEELEVKTAALLVLSLRLELMAWYERRGYRLTDERVPFPSHDMRFGLPKRSDLEFCVLLKELEPRRF